ncbi:beta strand repeat-containing protein [Anatilimnocola sp. NA78]|uniref:beta strand repeat-containing protein n=1 Tax=Anatilimnocola sp. NA78 TaxID=3415683 RepID=UPI003CE585E5
MSGSFFARQRKNSQTLQRRRAFLGIESLEERTVMAGNVLANAADGVLRIIGDANDNQIQVTRSTLATNSVTISSINGSNTTINGQAGPVTINNVSKGVLAALGAGNDEIHLSGSSTDVFRTTGDTTIMTGIGNDIVRFTNYSMGGRLNVQTGGGNDQVIADRDPSLNLTVNGLRVGKDTYINTGLSLDVLVNPATRPAVSFDSAGSGNDSVTIRNSFLNKTVYLTTGSQNDTVDLTNNEFGQLVLIDGGLGYDRVNLAANTYSYYPGYAPFPILFEVKTSTVPNTAPTISPIGAQTTAEDTATAAIPVTVGDAQTAASALVVTATSSNQTLVPNANIVVGGTGANRTLVITPVANLSGTSTITVTVSDGVLTTTQMFDLNVTAVNDAPTVVVAPTATTNEDTAVDVPVTVADIDTAVASLIVSATSSNTDLIPNTGILVSGTDGNRTVSITPAANASGTSTITVSVSDGTTTTTQTFVVTVNPINDAPTLTVAPATTPEDVAAVVPVTVGDIDTAVGTLTVTATSSDTTLVPNANIVVGGSGANRTLTITPAANLSGTSTITVTVNDGALTTTQTFLLTVSSVDDAPVIATIGAQSTAEDTISAPISVNFSDVETDAGLLTFTAISSDQAIVPDANIVIGGADGARTLTINPAPDANGTVNITVSVNDGNTTTTQVFQFTVTPTNDLPTISSVADLALAEDEVSAPIAVTVSDIETAVGTLTVTAASSDENVVAVSGIAITGSDGSRTVVITPVANASGSTLITLTVSDGTATATSTFTVTVTALNDAPLIAPIADFAIAVGAPVPVVNVALSDVDTDVNTVGLTATSDNALLVTNGGLVVGGAAGARTLTITPEVGITGSATITLTATEGANTVTETFTITIENPPTISDIVDQIINEDTPTGSLAFTIADLDSLFSELAVTATSSNPAIVPATNVVFGSEADGNRTLVVTPAPNATGTSTITVTVTDENGLTAVDTFTVTVNATNDNPSLSAVQSFAIAEGEVIPTLTVEVSDIDLPADTLTLTAASSDEGVISNAGILIEGTGSERTITLTPVANAVGPTTITLTLSDGNGGTAVQTFTITIANVNDAPIAVDDTLAINSNIGGNATLNVLLNDSDADAATTLTVSAVGGGEVGTEIDVQYGSFTLASDGVLTFTVDPASLDLVVEGEFVEQLISYTVSDGLSSDIGQIIVRITKVTVAA